MARKVITRAELARMAGVSRTTFYKELTILLTDPEARAVLAGYKKKLGYSPTQVDYITEKLPFFK